MMRARTVREGSVGVLILLGISLFGALVLWLRGVEFGKNSYKFVVEFASAAGLQDRTPVRYRGVTIGRVVGIQPKSDGIDVTLEIIPADLILPKDVLIEVNQSGLVSATSVDITPKTSLPEGSVAAKPLDSNCPEAIICNNSRLVGQMGVSFDEMVRTGMQLAKLYSSPELFSDLKSITKNMVVVSQEVPKLTRDLSGLAQTAKVELKDLSQSMKGQLGNFNQSVDQKLGVIVDRVASVSVTAEDSAKALTESAVSTANSVGQAADQLSLTARQVNMLLETNRSSLMGTLNSINQTAQELSTTIHQLTPVISRVEQGQLIHNLEVLSANAAEASSNLRDISRTVNTPTTLTQLQDTLNAAQVTLQNVQKITSDIENFTGDQTFRNNLKKLINGLGGLFSSTEELQRQSQLTEKLMPLREAIEDYREDYKKEAATGVTNSERLSEFRVSPEIVQWPGSLSQDLTHETAKP